MLRQRFVRKRPVGVTFRDRFVVTIYSRYWFLVPLVSAGTGTSLRPVVVMRWAATGNVVLCYPMLCCAMLGCYMLCYQCYARVR